MAVIDENYLCPTIQVYSTLSITIGRYSTTLYPERHSKHCDGVESTRNFRLRFKMPSYCRRRVCEKKPYIGCEITNLELRKPDVNCSLSGYLGRQMNNEANMI